MNVFPVYSEYSIWRKFILSISIVIAFLAVSIKSSSAQTTCPECPKTIVIAAPGIVQLFFGVPMLNWDGHATFFDDQGSLIGSYTGVSIINGSTIWEFDVPPSFCCEPFTGTITMLGKNCQMVQGVFQSCAAGNECSALLNDCQVEIFDLIGNHRPYCSLCKQWLGVCNTLSTITHSGKVGIGTNSVNPGFNLAVAGGIVTDLIKVELCEKGAWCDYVFGENYDLASLYEVVDFIKKFGHLPNTPTAQEIEKEGGFELKSVKLNQQEKIEEIFLHLIEINGQVYTLRQKIGALEMENEKLRNSLK